MTLKQIVTECGICAGKREITDRCARAVCNQFISSKYPAITIFAAVGVYNRHNVYQELVKLIIDQYDKADTDTKLMLDMLGTYILNREE